MLHFFLQLFNKVRFQIKKIYSIRRHEFNSSAYKYILKYKNQNSKSSKHSVNLLSIFPIDLFSVLKCLVLFIELKCCL